MNRLDHDSYQSTFGTKMVRKAADQAPPFDFWPYIDAIPEADFEGYDCSEGSVQCVWRSDDGFFEHVLINSKEDSDVFMAIVLDLTLLEVFGHRLLDLKAEYRLRD